MELTKEYFDSQLERLNNRMDGFATKDDLLELATKQDINSLKASVNDIQEKVTRIDQRTDEDTRAALKDIVSLQKRVTALEKSIQAH
jgi:hypothetical protein